MSAESYRRGAFKSLGSTDLVRLVAREVHRHSGHSLEMETFTEAATRVGSCRSVLSDAILRVELNYLSLSPTSFAWVWSFPILTCRVFAIVLLCMTFRSCCMSFDSAGFSYFRKRWSYYNAMHLGVQVKRQNKPTKPNAEE